MIIEKKHIIKTIKAIEEENNPNFPPTKENIVTVLSEVTGSSKTTAKIRFDEFVRAGVVEEKEEKYTKTYTIKRKLKQWRISQSELS